MRFLRSLNTHFVGLLGLIGGLAGLIGTVAATPAYNAVLPALSPKAQATISGVVALAGVAAAYLGRPKTIAQSPDDLKTEGEPSA